MQVLVTGATGYIGGRLVPRLLAANRRVRVLVRDLNRIAGHSWRDKVEAVEGSLRDRDACARALHGVDAAYYLVHSLTGEKHFAAEDRRLAENFCSAAAKTAPKTIYLGGLLPDGGEAKASPHLRSRAEVGRILRKHLPVTEFRAGPVIGSGSASFEMVRYLTERLPAMVAPRWILNEVQPVAIRDVLAYLLGALEKPPLGIVDIGANRLSFRQMMLDYAAARGLRRVIIPIPFLHPRLAASWIGLVTPIPGRLAKPLVEGVATNLLANTEKARREFPEINPLTARKAVELAIAKIRAGEVETRWSGALGAAETFELKDWEGLIREVRTLHVPVPPSAVFRAFCSLGGENHWLVWRWAWEIRGLIDRLIGGPGLRRGRRDPEEILSGEALDFWRVEQVKENTLLRLRAEMKVPGHAWLQYEVFPEEKGSRLTQTALFAPEGLSGAIYWYTLYPIHRLIFSDLVRAVARRAIQLNNQAEQKI